MRYLEDSISFIFQSVWFVQTESLQQNSFRTASGMALIIVAISGSIDFQYLGEL